MDQKILFFPESLKEIRFNSFFCAKNIRFVQFLSESIVIGPNSFCLCDKLELISFENATEISLNDSFKGINENALIIIPTNAKINYIYIFLTDYNRFVKKTRIESSSSEEEYSDYQEEEEEENDEENSNNQDYDNDY